MFKFVRMGHVTLGRTGISTGTYGFFADAGMAWPRPDEQRRRFRGQW
jgi:hypothetical protein